MGSILGKYIESPVNLTVHPKESFINFDFLSIGMPQDRVFECPECHSRNVTLGSRGKLFVYECKDCSYIGQRVIEINRLDDEKRKLLRNVLTPRLRREIEESLKSKKKV